MQTLHLIDVTLRTLHYGRFIFSAITSSITLLSLRYRFCELSLASYHFAITFGGAITFVLVLSYHLSDSQSDRVVYHFSYLIDYQFCSAAVASSGIQSISPSSHSTKSRPQIELLSKLM